ncbi:MAG: peptidoglycan DD-metalloendopeptidase family protein [Ruminococcaceae bacterium]|nr:peptidoglycan DD-metalloendopeptidase family protein [Oscillospiraceae bacterium]
MVIYPMKRIGVTAGFGMYSPFSGARTMHYALDISRTQPQSFDVFAAHDGEVILSAYDAAGGNMVAVKGGYNEARDIITRYAHLKSRAVKKGAAVKCGEVIGVQGNTGAATTGQHLHFETWLVPKGYAYAFADRPKYAVDPLAVCELTSAQTFVCDELTRGYEAIPYPEPAVSTLRKTSGWVTVKENLPFGLYPSKKYSHYVAGYDRSRGGILDFCDESRFEAVYLCENEGISWALIKTPYGLAWLPLYDEKAIFEEDGKEASADESPESIKDELDRCRALLSQIKSLANEI